MPWLRVDDGEVLDDRIGDLTDREDRARHALLQYLAREHSETGIFHAQRSKRVIFSTPKGVLSLTTKVLSRLIELGLVQRVQDLSDEYLESLGIERPEGPEWLRPSHWERYNPPRDTTNAARQRRYRETLRNAVTPPVTNAMPRARAFPSRPVTVNGEEGSSVYLDLPNEARPVEAGHENEKAEASSPYFALLVAACGDGEDAFVKLRRAARGKPEAAVVTAGEAARGPGVVDPLAVALAELGKWSAQ